MQSIQFRQHHQTQTTPNPRSFPQIVQRACRDGTDTIQRILENDRCLFNGISISDVHLDNTQATQEELIQIEASETISNAQHLKVLADRGQFRQLSSSDDPADKFLVYTPNTLPYNSYYNKWRSAKAVTPVRFSFLAA